MRCSAPDRASRRQALRRLALAAILAAVATAAPPLAQSGKLDDHRLAVRAHAVERVYLAGRVTDVMGVNRILTDWTPTLLRSNRLGDLDTVHVQIGAVTFRARLMNVDTSVARAADADSEGVIDAGADAFMLLDDAQGAVTLVGYSGGLAAWTSATPGAEISLSATWFKGDR